MSDRNLYDVISDMIDWIPPDDASGLKTSLTSIRDSVTYSPPENMGMWWAEVYYLLGGMITNGFPSSDCGFKLLSIYSTRSVEELKKDFNYE